MPPSVCGRIQGPLVQRSLERELWAIGFAGQAIANDNVEFCKDLAGLSSCDAVFAPCVALENAKDRQEEKNDEWRAACDFDLIDVAVCAQEVGTENVVDVCKCIQAEAGCPRKSVGKCVANFAAQAQADRQTERLLDAFNGCF